MGQFIQSSTAGMVATSPTEGDPPVPTKFMRVVDESGVIYHTDTSSPHHWAVQVGRLGMPKLASWAWSKVGHDCPVLHTPRLQALRAALHFGGYFIHNVP